MQSTASPSVAAAVCVTHCTLRRALARDVELDSRLYRRAPGSVVARGCQIGFADRRPDAESERLGIESG